MQLGRHLHQLAQRCPTGTAVSRRPTQALLAVSAGCEMSLLGAETSARLQHEPTAAPRQDGSVSVPPSCQDLAQEAGSLQAPGMEPRRPQQWGLGAPQERGQHGKQNPPSKSIKALFYLHFLQ